MVNASKGVFISCDVPMSQFIQNLDKTLPTSQRFIIQMLKQDGTCMLVKPHAEHLIRDEAIKFRNKNSYAKPT